MSKRRVVVTGLGLLTPVGNTVEESWKNIVAGKSGIAPITAFDASAFSTRISGSVKDFDATEYLSVKDIKKMDIFIHFGIAAGVQALDDAGKTSSQVDEVILVGGQTRMPLVQEKVKQFFNKEPHKGVNPDEVVAIGAAIQAGLVAAVDV